MSSTLFCYIKFIKNIIIITNKKTLIASALILLANISKSQIIGKLVNQTPELTVNKEFLISNMQSNLQLVSNIPASFKKVEILDINDAYYFVFPGNTYTSEIPFGN